MLDGSEASKITSDNDQGIRMKTSPFQRIARLLSFACLCSPTAWADCTPLPEGVVDWWRGDSITGVVGGESGTFRAGAKVGEGYSGAGLEFGGSHDSLLLPTSFKFTNQDFTVECWIRRANANAAGNDAEGGEFFAGSSGGFSFGLTHEGRLYLSHVGIVSFYSTTSIRDTEWHHAAVTRSGGNLRFYLDGHLNATVPCSAEFSLTGPFAIGSLGTPFQGVSYGFRGCIDEIAAYSSPLSGEQVTAIYQAGVSGKCEGANVAVINPSFEELTGADLAHFGSDGKLLDGHYSLFPGFPIVPPTGFNAENAIPGWSSVNSAGTFNVTSVLIPGGATDGQNVAWINVTGHIRQTLSETFQPNRSYRLTVDVGSLSGFPFPGYFIGLFANGQPVAQDVNSVPVTPGAFSTASVSVALTESSPFIGVPIEIRLGISGSGGSQVDFDNVRLVAEPAVPIPTCVPAPAGLVAWYRGEGNFTDSQNAHPTTFAAPRYAPGKVGQALEFDGSNEVVIPDAPDLSFAAFTAEAWVYPTAVDGDVDIIMNKEVNGYDTIAFEFGIKGPWSQNVNSIPTGNLAVFVGGVNGMPSDYSGWSDGGASVPLNAWSHVVLSYGDGVARVYLNGTVVRTFSGLTGTLRTTPGALKIGSRSDPIVQVFPTSRFNGLIDEASLFSRALADAEVSQLFQAGVLGKCFSLPTDAEAPSLALAEPAAGTVTDDRFNLRGTAADNVAVTSLTWSWNGSAQGNLSLADGQFAANGLTLNAGLNTFVVTAGDAAGNRTSVTREVTLTALRTLRVTEATEVQEGKRISFPIVLESPGDVGGLTFRLNYDSAYLTEPQLDWGAEVGQSVNNVNATVAGELSASFALPGTSLAAGVTPVATVSFRARSVPFALAAELTPRIDSLSSATGAVLARGNAAVAGTGRIKPRKITADNNANQRLDIGDAVVVSRLQVGLEEQRSWDIGLNDLNGSANIDSGDIVKVLRTVVGLDPQPTPSGGATRLAVARAAVNTNDRVVLEFPDGPVAKVGQPYSVVVKVAQAGSSLSGLSFVVDYPTVLSLSAKQVGTLVPAGTLPLWNSAAGTVQLAAVSPTAWPVKEGVAAVLTFVPQADFAVQAAWPLQLRQIELTGSGFDVRAAEDVSAIVKSVIVPPHGPTVALLPQPNGSFRLEIRAEAGFEVVVEHSGNLTDWAEAQVTVGTGLDQPVVLNLAPNEDARFWRARNR